MAMAAGAANSLTYSYLNARQENQSESFWSADVSKSGALDVWKAFETSDTDSELIIQRKINDLKRLFHNGRQLWVKNLPRDATEREVRDLLSGENVVIRHVNLMSSGPGSSWARVILADPDPQLWEDWPGLRDPKSWVIRGHRVHVSPSPTDHLLCVARLPRHVTDNDFQRLVSSYGETKRCFLMRSQKTGDSKGYGFVEFLNKESAFQARSQLEGRHYEDHVLVCDWLDSSIVTFAGLQSKLLYVDNLPSGFRDMGEFRRLFSTVTNPPYCQIALKGGAPQDWGLVEFSKGDEAEDTLKALDGYLLHGSQIRVAFFIPGVRAINIYMKLLNDQTKGRALFPEPPTDTVFQQLQNLTKQNPAFVHSLHNIIATQLHTLNNNPSSQSMANTGNAADRRRGRGPSPPLLSNPLPSQPAGPASTGTSSSAPQTQAALAANAQAALSLILAAQHKATSTPQSVPPPPMVQHPIAAYRAHPNGSSAPTSEMQLPTNISVPPPPLYGQPPPPVQPLQPPPSLQGNPPNDLQKSLTTLLGTLNNAVQSQSVQQAAAGALIGILVQLLQGSNTSAQPTAETFRSAVPPPLSSPGSNWNHFLHQGLQNNSGPGSLGSAGSRGSSPISSTSPSTSPGRSSAASSSSSASVCAPTNGFITPIGSKRKYSHVLPSPEPSPENGYIGQHSQGLGGHYAESYLKRKKRN